LSAWERIPGTVKLNEMSHGFAPAGLKIKIIRMTRSVERSPRNSMDEIHAFKYVGHCLGKFKEARCRIQTVPN
jgi:hypothetical protein